MNLMTLVLVCANMGIWKKRREKVHRKEKGSWILECIMKNGQ